jgi:DHA3 family macrolide efflux protein-like MFS transporter
VTDKFSSRPSMLAVFRNRSFTLRWTGQLIAGMGSALTTLASSLLVFRVAGTALSVGLMLMATAAPTIFVGLLAGVFVDRYDRKSILVAADFLRAFLIVLIPFLVPLNLAWIYVIVALSSAITQFSDSAQASILPELASDEELSAANSLMTISANAATMVGFAAAGFIASTDINVAFYVNGISFAVSGLLSLVTHIPKLPPVEDTSIRAIGTNLRAGIQTVRDIPMLRSLFIILAPIFIIFGMQYSLWLPFAVNILRGTDFQFGLLESFDAVGIVLGSLVFASLSDRIREGQWLALSFIFMAFAGIAYSFSGTIAVAIFFIGVAGFLNAPSFIGRQLIIQRSTPREMRGRVNSAFFVVRDMMFVVGMLLAGLGDFMSVRLLYLIGSVGTLAAGIVVVLMPGFAQPVSEWRRILDRLKGVEAAPRLGAGIPATLDEINRFIAHRPELAPMTLQARKNLAGQTMVAEAPGGKIVVYRGETSSAAYFILKGSVGVGYIKDDEYIILNYLKEGDFFGEVAALTGVQRTANVIAEEESEFLIIPAKVLRRLSEEYADLREVFYTTMAERLSVTDLPIGARLDQGLLRELRTKAASSEK